MTNEKYLTNGENIAIKGYDVVAYFKDYKAIKGSKTNSVVYDGATFYFASKENQSDFENEPEKYLPQYGGWCAFAMAANNAQTTSDPNTFKIYNGKLYLFFNDFYQGTPFNTIIPWNADEVNLRTKADVNWNEMTAE